MIYKILALFPHNFAGVTIEWGFPLEYFLITRCDSVEICYANNVFFQKKICFGYTMSYDPFFNNESFNFIKNMTAVRIIDVKYFL